MIILFQRALHRASSAFIGKNALNLMFLDKTVKLWKVAERDKKPEGYNLKDENGLMRDPTSITTLRVPNFAPMELMVEASPKRVFANAHTYHINSISVNSDQETYLSADDLRINLWNLEITDQSFSILSLKNSSCNIWYSTILNDCPLHLDKNIEDVCN